MSKNLIAIIMTAAFFVSCGVGGGGGGGGGSDLPAFVSIEVNPTSIDSGDRMTVVVRVQDLTVSSVAVKVKFESQLSYVRNSAFLTVDDTPSHFDPTTTASANSYSYVVFYVSKADLEPDREGRLTFEVSGESFLRDGTIEVDADIDDPDTQNSKEFSAKDPKFEAQDGVSIDVRGVEPTPTPAPTVAATATAAA